MEKFFSKIRVTRGFEHKLSKYLGDSVCVCVGGRGGQVGLIIDKPGSVATQWFSSIC